MTEPLEPTPASYTSYSDAFYGVLDDNRINPTAQEIEQACEFQEYLRFPANSPELNTQDKMVLGEIIESREYSPNIGSVAGAMMVFPPEERRAFCQNFQPPSTATLAPTATPSVEEEHCYPVFDSLSSITAINQQTGQSMSSVAILDWYRPVASSPVAELTDAEWRDCVDFHMDSYLGR